MHVALGSGWLVGCLAGESAGKVKPNQFAYSNAVLQSYLRETVIKYAAAAAAEKYFKHFILLSVATKNNFHRNLEGKCSLKKTRKKAATPI